MPVGLLRFFAVVIGGLFIGIGALLVTMPSCTHQLTVEEADSALAVSCAVLARVMTEGKPPQEVERVVAQACQPGKTRAMIARILVKEAPSRSTTELLPFDPYEGRPAAAVVTFSDAGVP